MAPNSPACSFIHASMAGSRSTTPLNRSKAVLQAGKSFLSRIHEARNVLFRTAETLHLHPQASQRIDGKHPSVEIEGNHVCERATKGKGLRGLAQRIDKRVLPSASIAYICEYTVERCIRFLHARQHARRSSMLRGGVMHQGHAAASKRRGPDFLGLHHPVQN